MPPQTDTAKMREIVIPRGWFRLKDGTRLTKRDKYWCAYFGQWVLSAGRRFTSLVGENGLTYIRLKRKKARK